MAEGITLGKAYVQIMPSTKGMSENISKSLTGKGAKGIEKAGSTVGTSVGKNMAKKLVGAFAAAGIGTAIVKGIKASVDAAADLEQSTGGIEALYGGAGSKAAELVKKNAQNAFETVGMSANQYMENVTSFSASLLNSLDGDTVAAAKSADTAMKDMGDNANRFGTDLESIQNAYQGFAKQNYSMLDNLKLGYGGAKSEMERLLADAGKLSGQTYDISNLNDVYSAIHVIQQELNVTGTTANEAATTLSGSASAIKSAWTNVLGYLGTGDNEGLRSAISGLVSNIGNFLFNNLVPTIGNILRQLPSLIASAWDSFKTNVWPVMQEIAGNIISSIKEGFFVKLPEFLDKAPEMIDELAERLQQKLDEMFENGSDAIDNWGKGFKNGAPTVLKIIGKLIGTILLALAKILPKLLLFGVKMLGKLALGLIKSIPTVIKSFGEMLKSIRETLFGDDTLLDIGKNVILGIKDGIVEKASEIWEALKDVLNSAVGKVKEFFGIHSPSKLMDEEVGQMIGAGMARGITKSKREVLDSINGLSRTTFGQFQPAFAGAYESNGGNTYIINGVTYDDGTNVATAVGDLIRAVRIERRA